MSEKAPEFKLVPVDATEDQWGGIARDIVFWMRMHPSSKHTPATLVDFLSSMGRPIPAWFGEESELRAQNHVISKGTVAVLIYRAMLDAAPEPSPEPSLRCGPCNSPRKGTTCFKCGSDLVAPAEGWSEPPLPPVDRIRELAREVGYAIGEHGSRERDLDLIAVPWSDDAIDRPAFVHHLAGKLNARIVELEEKPLGRWAVTLQMDGWFKPIDLSVCPAVGIPSRVGAA